MRKKNKNVGHKKKTIFALEKLQNFSKNKMLNLERNF